MAAIFAFTCSCCGQVHEGSPSVAFRMPAPYASLSEAQRASMAVLSDDLCTITHDEGTDYFVRAVLEIPIHGVEEPFLWGVWMSLSEKSYRRYTETFDAPVKDDVFFGWLCNRLGPYPFEGSRGANVAVQPGGQRPHVFLHQDHIDTDALVHDQVHGISVARAQQIAEQIFHAG